MYSKIPKDFGPFVTQAVDDLRLSHSGVTGKLQQMHSDFPVSQAVCESEGIGTPFEILERLNTKEPKIASFHELEKWKRDVSQPLIDDLTVLIKWLPCDAVINAFGPETLLWAQMQKRFSETEREVVFRYLSSLGIQENDFRAAIKTSNHFCSDVHSSETTIHQLEVFRLLRLEQTGASETELEALIMRHSRPSAALNHSDSIAYSVKPVILNTSNLLDLWKPFGADWEWYKQKIPLGSNFARVEVNLGSPTGLLFLRKGTPQFVISFHAAPQETLFVNQIQGVSAKVFDNSGGKLYGKDGRAIRIKPKAVFDLDMKQIMLELATHFAKFAGFSQIAIQGAVNNKWTRVQFGETTPHISLQRAEQIYDNLARRNDFRQGACGNWYRGLA